MISFCRIRWLQIRKKILENFLLKIRPKSFGYFFYQNFQIVRSKRSRETEYQRPSINFHSESVQLRTIYFIKPFNTSQVSKFLILLIYKFDFSWECPGQCSSCSSCPPLSWPLVRKPSFWRSSILLDRLHLRLDGTRRVLQTENHPQLWRQVIPEICHTEQLQLCSRFSYKTQPGARYPPPPGIYDLTRLSSLSACRPALGVPPARSDLCGPLRSRHLLQAALQVQVSQPEEQRPDTLEVSGYN